MTLKRRSTLALSAGLLAITIGSAHAAGGHSGHHGHGTNSAEPWTSIEWIQTMRGMPKGDVVRGEKLAKQG